MIHHEEIREKVMDLLAPAPFTDLHYQQIQQRTKFIIFPSNEVHAALEKAQRYDMIMRYVEVEI